MKAEEGALLYNILICDDDRDIVSALDIYLTSDGYQTYHAYNGIEALKMVKERTRSTSSSWIS